MPYAGGDCICVGTSTSRVTHAHKHTPHVPGVSTVADSRRQALRQACRHHTDSCAAVVVASVAFAALVAAAAAVA
jgi:hypothetical protein